MILNNSVGALLEFTLSICTTPMFLFGLLMVNLFLLGVLSGAAVRVENGLGKVLKRIGVRPTQPAAPPTVRRLAPPAERRRAS